MSQAKSPSSGLRSLMSWSSRVKKKLKCERVKAVTHPRINGGEPVLMKIAAWSRELDWMETEIAVYQRICDKGVGPKFLGHVTEGTDGRIIGFITEWLGGARSAGPRDLDDGKKALARLHQLGIRHGDINKRLVESNGIQEAVLSFHRDFGNLRVSPFLAGDDFRT
ncbi:hypothetical protein E4U58_001954 [Claviceps cyperi]|nr:hypothetical protein E4U58_001954 [Claviceps cyperi]